MAKYTDGQTVVEAFQFDHTKKWPKEVIPWELGYQPGDGSWGHLANFGYPWHVSDGQWIITTAQGELELADNGIFSQRFKLIKPISTISTLSTAYKAGFAILMFNIALAWIWKWFFPGEIPSSYIQFGIGLSVLLGGGMMIVGSFIKGDKP